MSDQKSESAKEQEANKEEDEDTYFKENQTYSLDNKDEDYNNINTSLIKVEINIGNGIIKELDINSMDDIDKSINNFCLENKLSKEAKIPIKNYLLDELNKKISQCKWYFL